MNTSSPPLAIGAEGDTALKRETTRNRINQRAFRSRKQEYVRDLEEQVRRYQREGVKATQEVQIAARSVAVENSLLRKFLRTHANCDDQDIDRLLEHMRAEGSNVLLGSGITTGKSGSNTQGQLMSGVSNTRPSCARHVEMSVRPNATSCGPVPSTIESSQDQLYSQTSRSTMHPYPADSAHLYPAPYQMETSSVQPSTSFESENINPETLPSPRQCNEGASTHKRPEDSISCEEAAAIIAGLRMRDAEDAREELGCQSQASCQIKNIALLQLMNETF